MTLACALICAAVVTAGPLAGAAGAKRKNVEVLRPGKFVGATEEGGSLTLTVTRKGKIVGFTLTNATLYCVTNPATDLHLFPETKAEYTKVITITHAPIQMQEVSKKNPLGKKFLVNDPFSATAPSEGGLFEGKLASLQRGFVVIGTGLSGQVLWTTNNGPIAVSGTERCATKYIDWEAKRPRDPGLVSSSAKGPLAAV
jgi:hypothetical protein